jgi:hypothetical protein
MNAQRANPNQDGGPSTAGRSGQRRGRRWFLKMLVALAVGVFAEGGTVHAQGGPGGGGGGGVPDLVGTWGSNLPFVNGGVQVTLALAAGGQFNEVVTSADLGTTLSTTQGNWILSETATSDTFVLTLFTADQVFLKGPIIQLNGPNQFILALTSPGLMTFVRQGAGGGGGPGGGPNPPPVPDLVGTWVANLPLVNAGVQVTLTLTADGLFNQVVTSADLGTTLSTTQGTWVLSETATSDTFVLTLFTADQVFLKGPILQLNGPNQFILALTSPGLMTFVRQH